MIIQSARLRIRPWKSEDALGFFELTRDDGFNRFPITVYRQPDPESARRWVEKAADAHARTSLGKMAVIESGTGVLIGMGGLTPWVFEEEEMIDVTYRLKESAWGRGYGTELARALVRHAFEALDLPEVTATITPDNAPSRRIAERLGMARDRAIVLKGVPTVLYRLKR